MARSKKTTVDYFPHFVHHGKTLDILESYYDNDGYAFYYKLMELLGLTEGHCYDCTESLSWEYLLSYTRVNEQSALGILSKLAELQAIDTELWREKKIWIQTFVDHLSELYRKRVVPVPEKPNLKGILPQETLCFIQTSAGNTQSKVKKNKEKKSKEDNKATNELPKDVDSEIWNAFVTMRKAIRAPLTSKAQELILKELQTIHTNTGQSKADVLLQSIKNSWRDVYPVKHGGKDGYQPGNIRSGQGSRQIREKRFGDDQCASPWPVDFRITEDT